MVVSHLRAWHLILIDLLFIYFLIPFVILIVSLPLTSFLRNRYHYLYITEVSVGFSRSSAMLTYNVPVQTLLVVLPAPNR